MDVMKTRMQILGQTGETMSTSQLASNIYGKEGVRGFYSGLSAAILRQITYTTARLGLYGTIRDAITPSNRPATIVHRVGAGVGAGGLAAFMCNPVEVCLVRMQADGRLPAAEQRGYKHVGDALVRIASEEGFVTYYRGSAPTVVRAIVVSVTQVAGYDQIKSGFLSTGLFQDNILCHLSSSVSAGFLYSLASLPFDTTKTRMQNQKPGADGKLPYTGTFQTMTSIIKQEGATSLWKGFLPYFGRCGGHTVFMFIFVEQYKRLANYVYN
jgi:solute carrier family 25 oxoglutarate transporter 11|uniref:Uncharacterized protein n=1 Tax=Eutreptiella gymnastica TaxID=73025 RepID=A0A7S4LEC9_9EUGL